MYAAFTGYGEEGPDADRAGFDTAAFCARAGVMALLGEPRTAGRLASLVLILLGVAGLKLAR